VSETTSETPPPLGAQPRLPADYYDAPASEVRPVFPKWVPFGCGTAAAVFLLLGFIAGAVIMHKGLGSIMAIALDMEVGKLPALMAKDVTPAQRNEFKSELAQLSKNVESDKTSVVRLQPVLEAIKDASEDKKLTSAEVARLNKLAHEANQPAKKPLTPSRRPGEGSKH